MKNALIITVILIVVTGTALDYIYEPEPCPPVTSFQIATPEGNLYTESDGIFGTIYLPPPLKERYDACFKCALKGYDWTCKRCEQ